jgi:hypothetical protein
MNRSNLKMHLAALTRSHFHLSDGIIRRNPKPANMFDRIIALYYSELAKRKFTTLPKLTTKQYRQSTKPRPTNRGFVLSGIR